MIQFNCAHLNIYIRNKKEEIEKLSKLYNFLKLVLNKKEKFSPHTLEQIEWLNQNKWYEVCRMSKDDNYVKFKQSSIPINIGDEFKGIGLEIKKIDNFKLIINIHRREMMFEENVCLSWHYELIILLIENDIADTGCIYSGVSNINAKWYSFKRQQALYIGNKNFLILDEFPKNGVLYQKEKDILTVFLKKNWDKLNEKDNVLIILQKDKRALLKKAQNSFFSELFTAFQLF